MQRDRSDEEPERTYWNQLNDEELQAKLDELNEQLKQRRFRSRFKVDVDEYGWDVIIDDGGEPEVVNTVEEAEDIVEELCSSGG